MGKEEKENKIPRKIQIHRNTGKEGQSKKGEQCEELEGATEEGGPERMGSPEREGGSRGDVSQRQEKETAMHNDGKTQWQAGRLGRKGGETKRGLKE